MGCRKRQRYMMAKALVCRVEPDMVASKMTIMGI